MMNLKRAMVIGMVTVGAVSMIGCAVKDDVTKEETAQEMTTEVVTEDKTEEIATSQIANPFIDVDSLEEAATMAGFEMIAPESIEGYDGTQIQVIENDLIQVIYGDLEHNVYVRKSTAEDDISGDYNTYTFEKTITEDEIDITVKGNEDINLILWTNGEYTYSVYVPDGVTEDSVLDIVNVIK